MNTPAHHSDHTDSWFRHGPASEHQAGGTWGRDNPLTGPLPAAAAQAGAEPAREVAARHLAADEPPVTPRQHAERMPRYSGPVMPEPVPEASAGTPTVATPVVGRSHAGIPPSLAPMLSHDDPPTSGHQPGGGPSLRTPPGARSAVTPGVGTGRGTVQNPAVRIAVMLLASLAAVPALLVLYQALFAGDVISASGAIGGTLMLIGLPMTAAGLLPLISGAAPDGRYDLLRPPVLYLVVGLVLLLAAGGAAG